MADLRLEIDELDLHRECALQAAQVGLWQKRAAEAEDVMDRAKAAVELSHARLDLEIRRFPEKFGLSKISEGSVSAAILSDPEHQIKIENHLQAKARCNKAKAAVQGLWSRDKMLTTLKDLYVHEYYESRKNPDDDAQSSERERLRRDDL